MNALEELGFEVYEVDTTKIIYKQTSGYERMYVQIDFSRETVNYWAVFEDSYAREILDVGVPLNVLEASIDILHARKVELVWPL